MLQTAFVIEKYAQGEDEKHRTLMNLKMSLAQEKIQKLYGICYTIWAIKSSYHISSSTLN